MSHKILARLFIAFILSYDIQKACAGEPPPSAFSHMHGVNLSLLPPNASSRQTIEALLQINIDRIEKTKTAGFNTIRLRIPLEIDGSNKPIIPSNFILILMKNAIEKAQRLQLGLVVAFFVPSRNVVCEESWNEYISKVSKFIHVIPDVSTIGIEPINEPPDCPMDRDAWSLKQQMIYRLIRREKSKVFFVATGSRWGSIDGLVALDPSPFLQDSSTLFSFHYYEPFIFTHQGVSWLRPDHLNKYVSNLSWPSNRENSMMVVHQAVRKIEEDQSISSDRRQSLNLALEREIKKYNIDGSLDHASLEFQKVMNWGLANGVSVNRIFLGEFGVHRPLIEDGSLPAAPFATSSDWLFQVKKAAEHRMFGWLVWDLDSGFSVLCAPEQSVCKQYNRSLLQ